jgi:membrane protein
MMSKKLQLTKGIRKLTWPEVWQVTKSTFIEFFQENSFFHGAALAYYAVFALVPMIYLSLISFGKFVGQANMLKIIDKILREEVGLEDSSGIMSFLEDVNFEKGNFVLNVVGVIALLLSSSALLASLRTSINEFFDIHFTFENRKRRIFHNLGTRLMSVLMLPVFGLVIVLTYFGETVILSMSSDLFGELSSVEGFILDALQHGLAIFTNVLLFTIIFKYLNDGRVEWKLAISGAMVTAMLLYVGQLLIKYYLKNYFFGSSIGLPGTILVMLAWMYYSSQIIFLGAKFTKVYATKVGRPIIFQSRWMKIRRAAVANRMPKQ